MPVGKSKPQIKRRQEESKVAGASGAEKEPKPKEQAETHQKPPEEKKEDQSKNQTKEAQEKQNGEKQVQLQNSENQPQNSFDETKEKTKNQEVEFDFSKLELSKSASKSKWNAGPGVLSVINSKSNSKRVSLSKDIMEYLDIEEEIQIGFLDDKIIIGETLSEEDKSHRVRRSKHKGIIYSSELVQEISDRFNLDFEDRVSITFYEAEHLKTEKGLIVAITID